MYYKIAQLILTPSKKISSSCEVFVAQPDAHKESLAGKLFALIEIESKSSADLKIINFIINNLNQNYYQSEKIILRERTNSLKIEHIFESALAKTNRNFLEFLHQEKIKFNPNIIHIIVGVVFENSLHFSSFGNNKALLIYKKNKTKNQPNDSAYNVTNVLEVSAEKEKKQANTSKIFQNVISGSIPSGGYFIFTNETLPEYLTNKQLIDMITSLPPASAVEQIKNILIKINAYVPFLGILIKSTTSTETKERQIEIQHTPAQSSVESLYNTEEKTEKLLTPSGIIQHKRWISTVTNIVNKIRIKTAKQGQNSKTLLLKDKIIAQRNNSWFTLNKIVEVVKNLFKYSLNLIVYSYNAITKKGKSTPTYEQKKEKISNKSNYFKICD